MGEQAWMTDSARISDKPLEAHYTSERTKPPNKRAKVGELGKISQCLGGDVVCIEFGPGRYWFGCIAWPWPGGDAQVHLWSPHDAKFPLTSEFLKMVSGACGVRWMKVRR